jgi:hypothetical protein
MDRTYPYQHIEALQQAIVRRYHNDLCLAPIPLQTLPSFEDRLVVIANFLPDATCRLLRDRALTHSNIVRSYVPGHKKGGAVSYATLHSTAPEMIAFYHHPDLQRLCSAVVGVPVAPTPINDQVSCALLFYDQPDDHIGWHYDINFYKGRHFTALYSLVNGHCTEPRLSSARLMVQRHGQVVEIPTPANTFVLFEGAHVHHRVTRLAPQERRILISMTFCTDPTIAPLQNVFRKLKDMAYFGVRALWR